MKLGLRTPNLKKSLKAMTIGKAKIVRFAYENYLSVYDKLTAKNKRILWHSIISKIVPKGNTKTFDIFLK